MQNLSGDSQECSVCENLQIVPGCLDDYKFLARYHYRDTHPGPVTAIFALKAQAGTPRGATSIFDTRYSIIPENRELRTCLPTGKIRNREGVSKLKTVGVVVYSTAGPGLELRNTATDNFLAGFDRSTQLSLINANIRRISRLIIEPRYRGLGLASRLVRETMPLVNVPIIEAVAVMGWVNPFLERAGMKAYTAKPTASSVQFIEALGLVGIEQNDLIDPGRVQNKFDRLGDPEARFIEHQIRHFLKSHGRRRNMPPGIERTRYVLTKLTARPVYYIWFNPSWSGKSETD